MVLIDGIGRVNGYQIGPNVNLRGARLNRANLKRANLSGANLTGANVSGADLEYAILTDAILSGANLNNAILRTASLNNINLSNAKLKNAYMVRANLTDAKLIRANLASAFLDNAICTGADFTHANLSGADLQGANLSGANLSDANLLRANLTGANLTGANLTGVTGANLYGAIRGQSQFERDSTDLQRRVVEPNSNISDYQLQQQIDMIQTYIGQYSDRLAPEFRNELNEDLQNTRAELERRHPVSRDAVEARRAETSRQIEMMRSNAAAAATAVEEDEPNEYGVCPICLEAINSDDKIIEAHNKGIIRQGHFMHNICFRGACSQSLNCPICRKPMDCGNTNQPLIANKDAMMGGKLRKYRKSKNTKIEKVRRRTKKATKLP